MCIERRQCGVTLIELIMFIVIVSAGIAGILSVLNVTVFRSADPVVQKQAQALAEGLLEEIQTAYFAYCDGADPQLRYAKTVAACSGGVGDSYGPETAESRPYDSVIDYASAANTPTSLAPVGLPATMLPPAGYNASVTIGPAALGDITQASGDALLIQVRVAGPGAISAVAEGYKVRQVPQ
jgi:MSHA pilin protein MshD